MLIPWGIMSAPKPPCISRPTMIMVGSTDNPHRADPAVKPPIPIRNRRRFP